MWVNGLEFTWHMIDILVWPVVALAVLLFYRDRVTTTVAAFVRGRPVKKFKLWQLEVEFEDACRNVAGALADTATLFRDDGPIPTSLVDLIPVGGDNPRRAIHLAFQQVRRALSQVHPQLSDVSRSRLPASLRQLVRNGAMDEEVERAVTRLEHLLSLTDELEGIETAQANQFLMLAEGAIHAILRSAKPQGFPIKAQWRGTYNGAYTVELAISSFDGDTFRGTMAYPGSDTTTVVEGRFDRGTPGGLAWVEKGYENRGSREIDFAGEYRAVVQGDTMKGAWYRGERLIARFRMTAG